MIFSIVIFIGSLALLAYLFVIWKRINELSRQGLEVQGQKESSETQLQECLLGIAKERKAFESSLQETNKDLASKEEELEKFRTAAVRRELRMTELKKLLASQKNGKSELAPDALILPQGGLKDSEAAVLNLLEDIKEAQEDAEEEKRRTLAVISGLTDGILVFDESGKISLVNHRAEQFLKMQAKDLVGRLTTDLAAMPALQPLAEMILQNNGVFNKDLTLREDLIIAVSRLPLVLDEQQLGSTVVMHDVTRERLVEKIKTEFVSLSAHQLRTPLSAIKWTLKMVLEGDLGKLTQEQAELLQKSYQSNERMIRLINELLEVTRMEDGRYLSVTSRARLDSLAESVVNSFKEEADRKNLQLIFEGSKESLPEVKIDIEKMRLAIANLLDNSIRYTMPGGQVTVSLKYDKKGVECQVQDTGIGIPENQKNRIFERFYRSSNAIRLETEGSGLGLYITKNIVEAHGGKVWFASQENAGSTFSFWLPEA